MGNELDIAALLLRFVTLFHQVVLPILLLAGLGYLLHRFLDFDIRTLTALNFYVTIPALIFCSVVTARVLPGDVGKIVLFAILMLIAVGIITYVAARLRGIPRDQRNALLMTTMFHNSGNYGLPLQQMAFQSSGMGDVAFMLQVFYVLVQNFTNFTLGVLLATTGGEARHWKESIRKTSRFPPIYALLLGLATVQLRRLLGDAAPAVTTTLEPFWVALLYAKSAFFAVALVTLGARLAIVQRTGPRYPVTLSVLLRLIGAPVLGIALTYALGYRGFLAQVLVISTCTPTAVNCMLLCLECDNHPDFAAQAVFYSTLLSPITVTFTILVAQGGFLPHLG